MTAAPAGAPPEARARDRETSATVLGLRENWRQFWLLVLINAFVGAMVGLERTVLPLLAEREFGLASTSAALSFIATFGVVKAITNLVGGRLGDRFGRKHVLVAGWLIGIPVPFLVMWAPTWSWIIVANVLLGVNQGLAWSTTVIMKIDLVGPKQRGLAMGLNEFAGYLAVAIAAYATGAIAERYGLRPEPFYLGIAVVGLGLALSLLFVRDTTAHVRHESSSDAAPSSGGRHLPGMRELFALSSWRHPALFSASQAGLMNNLNDGLAWGLFPLFFAAAGLSLGQIGLLLSRDLGCGAALDGRTVRSGRQKAAHRRRHARAGNRVGGDGRGERHRAMDHDWHAARHRDRNGVPHPARGHQRRRASVLARHGRRRLPVLARPGICRRRPAGRRAGGCIRDGARDRRDGPVDGRVGAPGRHQNAGNAACTAQSVGLDDLTVRTPGTFRGRLRQVP